MFRRRKDDEDPFAALRDGSTYQSKPTTFSGLGSSGLESNGLGSSGLGSSGLEPEGSPAKVSVRPNGAAPSTTTAPRPASPSARPTGPRRTGRAAPRRAARGIRLGVFAIVAAVIAINVVRSIHTSNDGSVISTTAPTNSVSTSTPAPAPAAPKPASYLTPGGLRAGLAEVRKAAPGASLTLLRLDATSFIATAALRNGSGKSIYLLPSGTDVAPSSLGDGRPVPLSAIKPNAIGRLTAELNRRFHVRAAQIEDIVMFSAPPAPAAEWYIFTKVHSHRQFTASLSGSNLTPNGG